MRGYLKAAGLQAWPTPSWNLVSERAGLDGMAWMLVGNLIKYRAPFKGAFEGLIEGMFRADRRYLDALCGLSN